MFPNLREISFSTCTPDDPQIDASNCLQSLHTTCELEKIEDSGACELAPQLAMSNLCNKLKTLKVELRVYSVLGVASNFISLLDNMPVLEDLSMTDIKFKLIDLETMHNNLPSLKRLCLEHACPISGEIPRDVVPANLVTKLNVKINQVEDRDTYIQFYKYIGNKYLSAIILILDDDMKIHTDDQDTLPRIYNEGIFPLYQKLGSKADTFIFNDYCDGLDAFRKFDDYGMKLKELTIKSAWQFEDVPFIEELSQSQQSKYIQKLILCDIRPDPIHMIYNLEALDTLDIYHSFYFDEDEIVMRKEFNFTQLIDACPATLTTLTTDNFILTFDGPASNITSIKHLTITDVEVSPMLAKIIETSFPNLSTFKLAGEIKSNVTISLLKHKLKKVSITALYNKEKERNEYTIESKCDDGIQYHSIKRSLNNNIDGQLYAYDGRPNPSAKIEPNKSYTLKFICPSVEQLSFFVEKKFEDY
jgi:hypothetical protein